MAKRPTFSGMELTGVFTEKETGDSQDQQKKPETKRPASRIQVNRQSTYTIQISAIRPDRYQARHVLPRGLRQAFFNGEADWKETVNLWLEMARKDKLIRLEMDELMQLGRSLEQDGQIKPITGHFVKDESGQQFFQILTGERRFWSTALRAVLAGQEEEPQVLALVDDDPTVRKQILENITHKPLTAIGKARAIARIILEEADVYPEPGESEYDYFERMFDVKTTAETAQLIEETLGISQYQYYRFRKLLELPQELQDLADQADIPEGILRQINSMSKAEQTKAVKFFLGQKEPPSVREFSRLLKEDALEDAPVQKRTPRSPTSPAVKAKRSIIRTLHRLRDEKQKDPAFIDKTATEVVGSLSPSSANDFLALLEDLVNQIRIRNQNRS